MRYVLGLALFACLAEAQIPLAADTHPRLTLAEAIATALKNHPRIAIARDTAAAAGQRVIEARAAYYPTIDAVVTGTQGYDQSRIGAGTLPASVLFNRVGQGLQVTQLVSDFGRTRNLVESSRYIDLAAQEDAQAVISDVILSVDRAFYGVLEAEAFVRVAQDTVRARKLLTDQVAALTNARLKSNIDLSFAQINLSQAQLLLLRSQDAVARANDELGRAMGLDSPPGVELAEPPPASQAPGDEEALVVEAIRNRPELRELRFRAEGAHHFEQAEGDLARPNISIIGTGGALPYINQDPRVVPHAYEGVGVNVEVPVFNGHLFSARREAAHFEAAAADNRVRDLKQSLERDVRDAWLASSTAYQTIPVAEALVQQAQMALSLAKGRYDLGLASIVEVSDAQLNLTQAQIESVTARYNYASALAALQYAVGRLH